MATNANKVRGLFGQTPTEVLEQALRLPLTLKDVVVLGVTGENQVIMLSTGISLHDLSLCSKIVDNRVQNMINANAYELEEKK